MSLPGSVPLGGLMGKGGAIGANLPGANDQEQMMVKYMTAAMESCPTKMVMAGVGGFALGGMFGLFMSSMRYDTPMGAGGIDVSALPMKQQLRTGLKDMGRSAYSSAKNFGFIGAVYSGVECCIEGYRAKNDLTNSVSAGCITGGLLAAKAGPQAMAIGCAGFAAFSAAIDSYMRMPDDGGGGRID